MEQTKSTSPTVRTLLRIGRFIGVYFLGITIFLMLFRFKIFRVSESTSQSSLFLISVFSTPLIWAFSSNFFKGLARFTVMMLVVMYINKEPLLKSSQGSIEASKGPTSYVGTYSGEDNGVEVKILVSPDRWYGEVIEGVTQQVISSEGGPLENKSLYDDYGNEIGSIQGDILRATIQGQRIRLTKD